MKYIMETMLFIGKIALQSICVCNVVLAYVVYVCMYVYV